MAQATAQLDVDYLASAAISQALTIGASLAALRDRSYATQTPLILLDVLVGIVDEVREQLLALTSASRLTAAQRTELSALHDALEQVGGFAKYVVRSADPDVPWSLVYPFEDFFRRLTPDSRVIIYPAWGHSYTYTELMGPLYVLMRGIRELPEGQPLPGHPRFLAALSFPPIQGPNILQNAAWGHEIAHHLDKVFGVSPRVLAGERFASHRLADPLISAAAPDPVPVAGAPRDESDPDYERAGQWESLLTVLVAWVRELVADIFSVHIFGPASLFAFSEVASTLAHGRPSGTHPPSWLRVGVMLNELRYLGYDKMLSCPPPGAVGAPVGAAVKDRLQILTEFAERGRAETVAGPQAARLTAMLLEAEGEIARHVRDRVQGEWSCHAQTIVDDVFHLVERLERWIPPCEVDEPGRPVGRATSLAAIVNAGWFYRIWRGLDDPPRTAARAQSRHQDLVQLNEIVLKAIELRDIKDRLDARQRGATRDA